MLDYDKIDKLLAERGMSRRELAKAAGINVNTMSAWFRRKTESIPYEAAEKMAEVLGTFTVNLMTDEITRLVLDSFLSAYRTATEKSSIISKSREEITEYTDEMLLNDFHKLSPRFQTKVKDYIQDILASLEGSDNVSRT